MCHKGYKNNLKFCQYKWILRCRSQLWYVRGFFFKGTGTQTLRVTSDKKKTNTPKQHENISVRLLVLCFFFFLPVFPLPTVRNWKVAPSQRRSLCSRVMFLCARRPLRVLRGEHALRSSSLLMLSSPCDTSVWGMSKSGSRRLSLFFFEGYKNPVFISVCAPTQSRNL